MTEGPGPSEPVVVATSPALRGEQALMGALFSGTATSSQLKPAGLVLSQIQARDPGFDETNFLAWADYAYHQVQRTIAEQNPDLGRTVMADTMWIQVRDGIAAAQKGGPPLPPLPQATSSLVAAHSDTAYDTIIVRFTPVAAGHARDWTFQRAATAVTKPGANVPAGRCPNCGAPLQLDAAGVCSYCKAAVTSGRYDWVLVRAEPVQDTAAPITTLVGMTSVDRAVGLTGCWIGVIAGVIGGVIALIAVVAAVTNATSRIPTISAPRSSTAPAAAGTRYTSNLSLTGALTLPGAAQSGTESNQPNCASLASSSTGFDSTYKLTDGSGLSLHVSHPTGPGSYDAGHGLVVTLTLTPPSGGSPNAAQSWAADPKSKVTNRLDPNGTDTVTFTDLQPQQPSHDDSSALSGNYTESCTNR